MTIEEILNIFLPGVACIYVYDALAMKRYPLQTYTVVGVIIGAIIKCIVDWVNGIVIKYYQTDFPIFVVYIAFAVIVGIAFYLVKNCIAVRKIFTDIFNVDPADNFWKMHIDLKKDTLVVLCLNNGDFVLGTVQSVDDDYITLRDHAIAKKLYDEERACVYCKEVIQVMKQPNKATIVCVPIKNIARFEVGYKNDSKYNDIIFRH